MINRIFNKRQFIIFSGYLFSAGFAFILMLTFLAAYLSDGKQTIVYIDKVNEADVELVLLIPILALIFIGLVFQYKNLVKERK